MEPNSNADAKIEAILRRKAGASGTDQHDMKIENGSERLISQRLQPGQVDASVPFSTWRLEAPEPIGPRVADQKTIDPPAPNPADAVIIGNVVIRPNMLAGTWEGRFTRGGDVSHEVLVDGERVPESKVIATIYAALREQANKKGK